MEREIIFHQQCAGLRIPSGIPLDNCSLLFFFIKLSERDL